MPTISLRIIECKEEISCFCFSDLVSTHNILIDIPKNIDQKYYVQSLLDEASGEYLKTFQGGHLQSIHFGSNRKIVCSADVGNYIDIDGINVMGHGVRYVDDGLFGDVVAEEVLLPIDSVLFYISNPQLKEGEKKIMNPILN